MDEKVEVVLEKHQKWLKGEEGGERATLQGADLRHADLLGADLREADLRNADLCGADLRGADRFGAFLPSSIVSVGGCGSAQRNTFFVIPNNQVICGCWDDGKGNTLESFKQRIEDVYGENGEWPEECYYQQYQAAIEFFEKMAALKGKGKD